MTAYRNGFTAFAMAATCLSPFANFCITSAQAQEPGQPIAAATELPEAQELFATYVKVTGGEEAHKKHTSRKATGTFSIPAQSLSGPLTFYQAKPDRMLARIEIPAMGIIRQGFDGKVAWELNPMTGPRILTEDERKGMQGEADFYSTLNYEKHYKSMITKGATTFEGMDCYEVNVVSAYTEQTSINYFEKKTGYLVGTQETRTTQMGDIPSITVFSDFKELDGVIFPMKTTMKIMGMEQIIAIETMTFNELTDSDFILPEEIKSLVDSEETEGEGGI